MGLLRDVLVMKLRDHFDEMEDQREANAAFGRMISSLAVMHGNTAALEQFKEPLKRIYGDEGYEKLLAGADLMPQLLTIAGMGDKALQKVGEDQGIPIPGTTPEDYGASPEDLVEMGAPTAQQTPFRGPTPVEPPKRILDTKITSKGDVTFDFEDNPEYEAYKRGQFNEAFVYYQDKANMTTPDAYIAAMHATGFPKKVNLDDLKATPQEKEEIWYRQYSTFIRNPALLDSVVKKLQQLAPEGVKIDPQGPAAQNALLLTAMHGASKFVDGFAPDVIKPFLYGTEQLKGESDLYYSEKEERIKLDLAYQDMLRKPIPLETARALGLPVGTPLREAISANLTPLTTAAQDNVSQVDTALGLLDKLEALSRRVHKSPGGPERFIEGLYKYGEYWSQSDPDAALYGRLKDGLLSVIARNAASEKGVLNEGDVGRAKLILPSLFDSELFAVGAFKELRDMLDARRGDALRPPTAQAYKRSRLTEQARREGTKVKAGDTSYIIGKVYYMKDGSIREFRGLNEEGRKQWRMLREPK